MLKQRIEDGVMIVTLENGKTNSLTRETLQKLQAVVKEVNGSESLKGIVLTGEGRFFSSGFDLPMFLSFKDPGDAADFIGYADEVLLDLFTCDKPVVCAMNGHSAAGGLILAMASDYRLVKNHPKIKLGMSEIKIGVPLSVAQGAVMRFGLDSDKRFRDVMYFGEMVDPETARAMEMVDEVVEEADLIARAKEIVALWIDTPNRPFTLLKRKLKAGVVKEIREDLAEGSWKGAMDCFFKEEVRQVLAFVQSTME